MYRPAADVDATPAYLFQCGRTGFFAVTLDAAGANLQGITCDDDWCLKAQFPLGVHEAIPEPLDPEPVLTAIRDHGYFVWREWSDPHAVQHAPGVIKQR